MSDAIRVVPSTSEVRKTLLLNCSQEHAFRVFTERMGRWWPATHHVGAVPFREIILEPRSGGRWYEVNANDEEGIWGHVLAWESPRRVVLSWHLDANYKFNPDLAHASEIEIKFEAVGDQTRIQWVHRGIERHGEGFQKLRDELDNGWVTVLAEYVKLAEATSQDSSTPPKTAAGGAP